MVELLKPAVAPGKVWHKRYIPEVNEFTYGVNYAWFDPDKPGDLCRHHKLWSHTGRAPVRFKAADYLDNQPGSFRDRIEQLLEPVTEIKPEAEIRVLTQLRRWGWLFNPITIYVYLGVEAEPLAAIAEVTNTPWKERHWYPFALEPSRDNLPSYEATFAKELHVSPFLNHQLTYNFSFRPSPDSLTVNIGVVNSEVTNNESQKILDTSLKVNLLPPSPTSLGKVLRSKPFSTHTASANIHAQAVRLWRKKVPFVAHPKRSGAS